MFVVYWRAFHRSGEHVNTLSSSVSSCIICFAVTTSECVHMNVMYMYVGSAYECIGSCGLCSTYWDIVGGAVWRGSCVDV